MADIVNIPNALLDLIRERRYNNVSVELFPEVDYEGNKFKDVLTAVALLGADLPAVKGLKELASSLFKDLDVPFSGEAIEFTEQTQEPKMTGANYTQEQVDSLVEAEVEKTKKAKDKEFATALSDKDTEIEKLTAERDEALEKVKQVETEMAEFAEKAKSEKIEALVDKAIEAGKVLPKNKERTIALGHSMSGKIKFGENEDDALKVFEDHLADLPAGVKLGEKGTASDRDRDTYESAADEVHKRALKLSNERDKLDYKEARQIVLSEDDDLKTRYLNMGD